MEQETPGYRGKGREFTTSKDEERSAPGVWSLYLHIYLYFSYCYCSGMEGMDPAPTCIVCDIDGPWVLWDFFVDAEYFSLTMLQGLMPFVFNIRCILPGCRLLSHPFCVRIKLLESVLGLQDFPIW